MLKIGKWQISERRTFLTCSDCLIDWNIPEDTSLDFALRNWEYCPNCGARKDRRTSQELLYTLETPLPERQEKRFTCTSKTQ